MQSNDARMLVQCAVPAALAGAVAAAVSFALSDGDGALGAAAGAATAVLFLGIGLFVLQRVAKSLPHLFQAMGLLLYTAQILLLAVVLGALRGTSVFDTRAFALSLLAVTLVWMGAQVRAHKQAKILYVQPEPQADTAKAARAGGTS